MRKHLYFGKNNSISFETGFIPMTQIGIDFGEDITIGIGFFVQFYFSVDIPIINSWLYKHGMNDRKLEWNIWFRDGWSMSLNLFSDTMGWKRGDWKWYINFGDKIKGKYEVSKKVIIERDILIPMPERPYQAHAVLADWTWTYKHWFPMTIRRCEINIPEGLPHEGKGENSWDCGKDATFGITTGKVKNIEEAVGNLVGSVLHDRVKHGGWEDYNWQKS